MIQINLLPEIKREYLKSQQSKHVFIVGAVLVSLLSLGLLLLMFIYVQFIQPARRSMIQSDIDKNLQTIKRKENGVKIATVVDALNSLTNLENQELATSRLFTYLNSFTPQTASYDQVMLSTLKNQLVLKGATTELKEANVLANNLKSASFTYTKDNNKKTIKPFKNVIFKTLDKSGQTSTNNNRGVSFAIESEYDPIIFEQDIKDAAITVDAASVQTKLFDAGVAPFSTSTQQPSGGGAQ